MAVFDVNGHKIAVRQLPRREGRSAAYYAVVEGRKLTGYSTSPDCHKDVLLTVLDDCGEILDAETCNWPEGAIRRLS